MLLHGCWRGIANLGPIIGNNEVDVIVWTAKEVVDGQFDKLL